MVANLMVDVHDGFNARPFNELVGLVLVSSSDFLYLN